MKKQDRGFILLIALLLSLAVLVAYGMHAATLTTRHNGPGVALERIAPLSLIVGQTVCPSGYTHASRPIPGADQYRYQDVCIIQGSLSRYCLLPSVDANYEEIDVVLCVNTGEPATQDQIAQGYFADNCTSNPYVPCYTPCLDVTGTYPIPCPSNNAIGALYSRP